ncbi:MAG TPA: phosphoesterase [Eubacteriales bacterium]|jgi:PHP family Zn ribbon phosphoesterase|nr:phosphoesterase [Clostridia bacterium]HRR89694.1 phosphoesterase [Eubacteriales bacterium]HRU84599.1 phosphoesterase [Eubacteriales bacterium]
MKFYYDLHIHSGLSPCSDKDMTPANIAIAAGLSGLDFFAVSDHNSVKNSKVASICGEREGVVAVPALELQTAEDIHMLCLFAELSGLFEFYGKLSFQSIRNRPKIFGQQFIYDEFNNIVDEEENLLIGSADVSASEAFSLAFSLGGIALPAHIDRPSNGMEAILGAVPEEYSVVEISARATPEFIKRYYDRLALYNSDAHYLAAIGSAGGSVDLAERSAEALLNKLRAALKR